MRRNLFSNKSVLTAIVWIGISDDDVIIIWTFKSIISFMKSSFLLLSGTVGLQACDATAIVTGTPYYVRNVANLFPGSSIIPSCSGNARRVRTDAATTPFSGWPQPRILNNLQGNQDYNSCSRPDSHRQAGRNGQESSDVINL